MKEFEVNGVQYMAVEVPPTGHMFYCDKSELRYYSEGEKDGYIFTHNIELPAGTWETVGLVRELRFTECPTGFEQWLRVQFIFKNEHNLNDNSLIIKKI